MLAKICLADHPNLLHGYYVDMFCENTVMSYVDEYIEILINMNLQHWARCQIRWQAQAESKRIWRFRCLEGTIWKYNNVAIFGMKNEFSKKQNNNSRSLTVQIILDVFKVVYLVMWDQLFQYIFWTNCSTVI